MTLLGAVTAAMLRKIHRFVSEVRAVIALANREEKVLVTRAKAEVITIRTRARREVSSLRNDLIDSIAKI